MNDNIFDLPQSETIPRQMTMPCTLLLKETLDENNKSGSAWECELHQDDSQYGLYTGHIVPIEGKHHWNVGIGMEVNGKELESGITTLFDSTAEIVQNRLMLNGIPILGRKEDRRHHRHLLEPIVGTRSVLAIHVTAKDTQTTASPETLSDKIFGVDGDQDNLVSGFDRCSHGKLKIAPAEHQLVTNGVYAVEVDMKMKGVEEFDARSAVIAKVEADMGVSLANFFSHIMVCLPPGTKDGWIGCKEQLYLSIYVQKCKCC